MFWQNGVFEAFNAIWVDDILQFFLYLATSQDKSSDDNENHVEINLNINLNGVGGKKMTSGEFSISIFYLTWFKFDNSN